MLQKLWNDQNGAIISAELVLVMTICVIGLVVGLSEVQHAVVAELDDVGEAIGHMNQSYLYTGFSSFKTCCGQGGVKARTAGSFFKDNADDCDDCDGKSALGCDRPRNECGGRFGGGRNCGGRWN